MNKLIAAALLALVAATPIAATMPAAAQAGVYSSAYYPEDAILDWGGERFTIVRIDSLDLKSQERLALESWMESSPDAIDALQNTILENGEFAAALRGRSVQLNNVVAIREAMSGNLIVYLR